MSTRPATDDETTKVWKTHSASNRGSKMFATLQPAMTNPSPQDVAAEITTEQFERARDADGYIFFDGVRIRTLSIGQKGLLLIEDDAS